MLGRHCHYIKVQYANLGVAASLTNMSKGMIESDFMSPFKDFKDHHCMQGGPSSPADSVFSRAASKISPAHLTEAFKNAPADVPLGPAWPHMHAKYCHEACL